MTKKTWEEFRETGLLLYINQILNVFGWAIVIGVLDDEIIGVYPARVKFRGFGEHVVGESYKKISKYIKKNAKEL